MKHLIALLVLASLAIVGCADNSSQDPVSAQSIDTPQGSDVPQSLEKRGIRFQMTVVGIGAPPPPFVQCSGDDGIALSATGTVQSRQLGRFTVVQGHCFNQATGLTTKGKAVMTDPRGKKLYA
jgi:hypothetical protein